MSNIIFFFKTTTLAAIILACTSIAQHTLAQDTIKTLNPIVITATKFPIKQQETGKVLTIITQEQLQQSIGKNLGEVLNQQVGITVSGANNTAGTNQTVFTRGSSSTNTLILVDGIPLYDAAGVNSDFDLNSFSLSQVEKIEILKGAQSTLYGADAVAGVINIITKKNSTKPVNLSADLSAGSYGTYKEALGLRGHTPEGFNYYAGYSKTDSKGFSAAYDSTANKNFDKDGFHQDAFQASIGYNAQKGFEVRAYTKLVKNRADIDAGAFADDKDFTYTTKNTLIGAQAAYHFNQHVVQFNYNYNWYSREYIDDSASVGGFSKYQHGKYIGKSHFAELAANFHLTKHLNLVAGSDYRSNSSDQSYLSISAYGPFRSRPLSSDTIHTNQVSGFASLLFNIPQFSAELGGRWNHHSVYGDNFTYSFGPSYLANNELKLFVNLTSGYHVPSLYQLYSEYGNKKLKPEVSTSFEEGVQYMKQNTMFRVVAFQRNTKNVITFFTDANYNSNYINEDKQKDYGFELEGSLAINKLSISANYTFVDGKINTIKAGHDTTYFNLFRRPKNTFNIDLGYHWCNALYTSVHLRTVSKLFEPRYNAAPIEMKGYFTLNFYAEYRFCKSFKVFADLQNITDEKYFDIRGFNSKRFNGSGGVAVNL